MILLKSLRSIYILLDCSNKSVLRTGILESILSVYCQWKLTSMK